MTIEFPASTTIGTMMCVPKGIVDDNIQEGTEFFTVFGGSNDGNFIGGPAQVSIADNDRRLIRSAYEYEINS
jgi:hypothetical protein